ncbi:NAD(P)-binding protein [Obba rivulosa]|uniref:NAD(P)-binding protein n=1 Tax=Obba rivulosa TaxID=1052685 RepID=A0A8E2DJK1_9APHY|nr:NAD(P)-binding protein [Obba rivulosa]
MVDILVLGATGFTGRLITRYLASHPERASFKFAVAARSKSKLEDLVKTYELGDDVERLQVDVTDADQVDAAVRRARVVINTVGPYWRWGTPVVQACARHGKHYVDLSGETHWNRSIIDKYDHLAMKTRAIIVPACGFDSVPADLLVLLSNTTLKRAAGTHTTLAASQTFYRVRGGVSGGTLATIISALEDVPPQTIRASTSDYYLSPAIRGAHSPRMRLAYPEPRAMGTFGTFFPMAQPNRAVVQRTWGLHALAAVSPTGYNLPRHVAAQMEEVQARVYGPQFTYQEAMVLPVPGRVPAVLFSVGFMLTAVILTVFRPVRQLLWKFLPKSGEGPSETLMQNGWVKATNYTSSVPTSAQPALHVKSAMRGRGDPGYLLTSVMIAESALALLLDNAQLPPLAHAGGVLTPASALGEVLMRRLEKTGRVEFESVILHTEEDEVKKDR